MDETRPEGEAVRIYRAYLEAEARRDGATMRRLLHPAIAIEMNGRPALASAEEDEAAMAALFRAYPDVRREIVGYVDGGTGAAIRWRMRGSPSADRPALPPLDIQGASFVTVAEGRMTSAALYGGDNELDRLLALETPEG